MSKMTEHKKRTEINVYLYLIVIDTKSNVQVSGCLRVHFVELEIVLGQ